jgi:hypothetical protein
VKRFITRSIHSGRCINVTIALTAISEFDLISLDARRSAPDPGLVPFEEQQQSHSSRFIKSRLKAGRQQGDEVVSDARLVNLSMISC